MAVVRLPQHGSDLVLSFNTPTFISQRRCALESHASRINNLPDAINENVIDAIQAILLAMSQAIGCSQCGGCTAVRRRSMRARERRWST